jgi:hypothetical protein
MVNAKYFLILQESNLSMRQSARSWRRERYITYSVWQSLTLWSRAKTCDYSTQPIKVYAQNSHLKIYLFGHSIKKTKGMVNSSLSGPAITKMASWVHMLSASSKFTHSDCCQRLAALGTFIAISSPWNLYRAPIFILIGHGLTKLKILKEILWASRPTREHLGGFGLCQALVMFIKSSWILLLFQIICIHHKK